MKKYAYSKDVKIPIYVGSFRIILTNQELQIDDNCIITSESSGKEVMTTDANGNLLFIVAFNIDDSFSPGIVSHECLHAVIDLFTHINLKLSEDAKNGNEAYTYMLGWFVNQVYDFMKEKNIKINKF